MKKILLTPSICMVLLFSCKKNENNQVDKINNVVNLGPLDSLQIFYDFDNQKELLSSKSNDINYQSGLCIIEGDFLNMMDFNQTYQKKLPETNEKNNGWDILFTKYTGLFISGDKNYGYPLTGILINVDNGVKAIEFDDEDNSRYDLVVLDDIKNMNFSSEIDIIGADWKKMGGSFPSITYQILPKYYIVKTTDNFYYKFRMTNYYADGIKSKITIQYQKL